MFGGIYAKVILFSNRQLQYLKISVIVFSSYKCKQAPFNNVKNSSQILTSKEIFVEAKHISVSETELNALLKA